MSTFDEMAQIVGLIAQQQAGSIVLPFAIGHVIGYDPSTALVQCVLPAFPVVDPITGAATGEYAQSPWMQWGSPWVGNGWGFQTAPEVGDATPPWSGTQCAICIVNQGSSASFVANALYTRQATPPDPTLVAGEAIFKHKSGTALKFHDDGSLTLTQASGSEIDMDASGQIAMTLPSGKVLSVNGIADALALVSKLVDAFNVHTHGGVQTGGGVSSTPSSPWSASTIESALVKVAS